MTKYDGTGRFRMPIRHKNGTFYDGTAGRNTDAVRAEGLVQAELRRRHWSEAELARRRKGDPEKVKMAWRLTG